MRTGGFLTSLAAAAAASSLAEPYVCPYKALPSDIKLIEVWDNRFCGTDRCVVDRDCNTTDSKNQTYSQNNYQAFGYFLDSPKSIVAWGWNFGGNSIDMSMAQFPKHITSLTIFNADRIALPTPFECHAVYLTFADINNFTGPTRWHSELVDLGLDNVLGNTLRLPAIPSNLTSLRIQRNGLSNLTDLLSLPPSLEQLNISQNGYTELANLAWTNLQRLHMQANDKLKRIVNVTFSSKLVYLQAKSLSITTWVMDNATYAVLNALQPERPGPRINNEPSLIGYNYTDLSIKTDSLYCASLNGEIKELWDRKLRSPPFDMVSYTVCVLSGAPKTTTVPPTTLPTPTATESNSNSALVIGLSAGAGGVVLLGLLIFAYLRCRRKEVARPVGGRTFTGSVTPRSTKSNNMDLTASRLALYRIDVKSLVQHHILGSGAFADVWYGSLNGEPVAIKSLHAKKVTSMQMQSFIQEIQLLGMFDSPYIVKLIGAAWTRLDDMRCVMEFMDCGDLRNFLDTNSPREFPWAEKMQHMYSIVQGLCYLHSMHIIHRDLKSRNVLLDSVKGTKLTDFGISREDIQATMTVGIGTFRWMAPEVIQFQTYSVAADIYSFGVVLSELDTHLVPYEDIVHGPSGQPIGDTAIMVQVVAGTLQPTFSPTCPRWIRDVALQCLSTDPEQRPTAMQLSHIIRMQLKDVVGRR